MTPVGKSQERPKAVGGTKTIPALGLPSRIGITVSWIEPDAARIYICARIQPG